MTDTTQEVPTTPTDEANPTPKKKRAPKRGNRKRLLGGGEGDYCIYEVVLPGRETPAGALLPIPGIPRFEDTVKAAKWIRKEGGNLLAGKQVMIFRAMEILDIQVQTTTQVVIEAKPRRTISDPKTDDQA
jgi:hypothetical protein